jgi:hypothetical protein
VLKLAYNWFVWILAPVQEEIRHVIRGGHAKGPLVAVARLKSVLEKHFRRGFSRQYVSKIAGKVARDGLVEIDRTRIGESRVASRRQETNYRMMWEEMLKIVRRPLLPYQPYTAGHRLALGGPTVQNP